MFFPKGFKLLLSWITGYDNVVEMYVIQICFLATLIILLLYSSLILGSITLGRSGVFGVIQAMASRYTTFSILAVVSIYVMLVKTAFERRSLTNTILLATISGIVLLSAAFSYSKGIEAGSKERVSREKAAFVLSTYES